MKYQKNNAKPFIKWAGGKGQLLSQLDEHLPQTLKEQEFTYIEPFVGGGAMLFYMLQKYPNIDRVIINDINPYLTTAYRVIKDEPEELIERLSKLENNYFTLETEEDKKAFFLDARTIFNEKDLSAVDRTTYLMFLIVHFLMGCIVENLKVNLTYHLVEILILPYVILKQSKQIVNF